MDKIIEKFSSYDFWGIMFPGIVFNLSVFSIYKWGTTGNVDYYFFSNLGVIIAFTVISFLIGTMLQEIAHNTERYVLFRGKHPYETFLSDKKILGIEPMEFLLKLIKEESNPKLLIECKPDNRFYNRLVLNYMNTHLIAKGFSSKSDKMLSIYILNRGLMYSFLFTIFIAIGLMLFADNIIFINVITCVLLSVLSVLLFYIRANRYAKARVKSVCGFYHAIYGVKSEEQ